MSTSLRPCQRSRVSERVPMPFWVASGFGKARLKLAAVAGREDLDRSQPAYVVALARIEALIRVEPQRFELQAPFGCGSRSRSTPMPRGGAIPSPDGASRSLISLPFFSHCIFSSIPRLLTPVSGSLSTACPIFRCAAGGRGLAARLNSLANPDAPTCPPCGWRISDRFSYPNLKAVRQPSTGGSAARA
jgi:hypothetical protein